MRAVVYSQAGGPDVLRLVERPVPEPGPGEVRVRVRISGVNPTDWKARRGELPVGEYAGLPLHRFPLERAADAHAAVEAGAVGKVLIDVSESS